ncbi:zinc-binding alcohol dehydrogenase family protein [Pseudomonas sp. JBR1]|uniref:zinc-binding alcohol dehydrogenase family protein n=1 Tax=Pseudomonas sp. JBR1 TaxID=3020907 RepID=UPI00230521EF|nr:zinc-binding alcohol dehydrogenase family protein [Pseudomonas sp. JBR1]WCE09776.1 zinc-binding alcohol dehydrogenase family protein [Pseudomonas sp. JBR1]
MLTIVCQEPGLLRAEQREKPSRRPDETLVRIERVGVCGTDLHIFSGNQPYLNYPRVMGHEISATVTETEADSGLAEGDLVYVMPYLSCGDCVACRQGKTNCCTRIQVLGVHCDGAMTGYLSLPHSALFRADGLDADQAAMVEFLAIGAHAVRRGEVAAQQQVLVVGAGPIGMAVALFARLRGARVTVLDGRTDRLAFCAEHLGVQATVALGEDDEARLRDLTGGDFFDVVFDATGNPRAMERGFAFIAHGGKYVLVSIVQGNLSFADPEFHKRETTLLGSRNATAEDFRHVHDCLRRGLVPTQALNTHRLRLEDVPEAFPPLLDPAEGVVKALIEC